MNGVILVEHESGRRSIYIASASIRIEPYVFKNPATYKLGYYRTNGYRVLKFKQEPEGLRPVVMIPMIDHLRRAYAWTSAVEVPQHVVDFAVACENQKAAEIDALAEILERSTKNKNRRQGFEDVLRELTFQKREMDSLPYTEEEIAKEILLLIENSSGGGYN